MALILNIDTATENASVAICRNGQLIGIRENAVQKEHASFLHPAIKDLFREYGFTAHDIDAVAITSGPGSYTGLRVAMAAAKGICYAVQKPLIAVNTLFVMAWSARQHIKESGLTWSDDYFICPMIDARRMEVFSALYNMQLEEIEPPLPRILSEVSIERFAEMPVYFVGNGIEKMKIFKQDFSGSLNVDYTARDLGVIANQHFQENRFSDMVYLEPEYLKGFYSGL